MYISLVVFEFVKRLGSLISCTSLAKLIISGFYCPLCCVTHNIENLSISLPMVQLKKNSIFGDENTDS